MEEQFKTLIVLSHYLEVCFCHVTWLVYIQERETDKYFILQTGRFRQFWDEAAKSRHMVEAVPGEKWIAFAATLSLDTSWFLLPNWPIQG